MFEKKPVCIFEGHINPVQIPFYIFSETCNLQGFKLQPFTRLAVVLNALPALQLAVAIRKGVSLAVESRAPTT